MSTQTTKSEAPGHAPEARALEKEMGDRILALFPKLVADERRVAVRLYRLLEAGEPVSREALASSAGLAQERLAEILAGWRGVFYEQERIIGFWGLTLRPVSAHRIRTGGRENFGWCAWDTLFLPELLGKPAEVESLDPETGAHIRLRVTPDGVQNVDPEGAVLSFINPPEEMSDEIVTSFCRFIHFFASRDSAARWRARNPGTVILSIEEGFRLGRLRNQEQFKEALGQASD